MYPKIASVITGINYENLRIQLIDSCRDKKNLSEGFNPVSPVSRYFKETVRNIEKTEDGQEFRDKEPRRLVPELWEYDYDKDVNSYLASKIDANYNGKNRFVVFVRFREDTIKIANQLKNLGYCEFTSKGNDDKNFCIITGAVENRRELLKWFSSVDDSVALPDVLILTYKISEQGIDLPAYNYTINYHIPASPSQLEQRFGRIDRLNSIHDELNTCFLIKRDSYDDSNTANFYTAVSTYINEFLPLLPSKNCLITSPILENFVANNNYISAYYNGLLEKCNIDSIVRETYDQIVNFIELSDFFGNYELLFFIRDRNVEFNEDFDLFKKNVIKELEKCILQVQKSKERINWWMENISLLSNNLFYIDTDDSQLDWSKKYHIETINPKLVANKIVESSRYIEFSSEFKKPIERMRFWNSVKDEVEADFEDAFHQNNFGFLFPVKGNYNQIRDKYFTSTSGVYSIGAVNELISTLPFFKMCEVFERIVQSYAYTSKGYLFTVYTEYGDEYDPLLRIFKGIFKSQKSINIQSNLFKGYLETKEGKVISHPYYLYIVDSQIRASKWLKLLYICARKEAFSFVKVSDNEKRVFMRSSFEIIALRRSNKDVFLRIDDVYKRIEKGNGSVEDKNKTKKQLEERFKIRSLFHHFFYTFDDKRRYMCYIDFEQVENEILEERMDIVFDDYLTEAIFEENYIQEYFAKKISL